MLLYSRCSVRPSGLQIQTTEPSRIAEMQTVKVEMEPGPTEQAKCLSNGESVTCSRGCEVLPSDISPGLKVSGYECQPSTVMDSDAKCDNSEDVDRIDIKPNNAANEVLSCSVVESSYIPISQAVDFGDVDMNISSETSSCTEEQHDKDMASSGPSLGLPNDFPCFDKYSSVSMDCQKMGEDSEHIDVAKCKLITSKDKPYYGNGHVAANKSAI